MDKRIAFVYDKLHPLHEKLMKEVNCDFIPFSKNLPKNYDVYIIEGTYIKPILLKKLGRISKEKKIITLFSDPRLFYLSIGKMFDFKKEKMVKYPLIRSIIAKKFIKELDGAICIGDFSASLFRKFNKKSPMMNVPAFVFKEKHKMLTKINPNLSSHNILFMGYGPDFYCKGLDLMIDVFKSVKTEIPDTKLYILGKWDVKEEWKSDGVYFKGEQNIYPYLRNSSLSLHIGRGESFGINVLESMLAGVPTIVSEYTGVKQAVEKVEKKFVAPLNKELISRRIIEYFKLNLKKKKNLSKKNRKIALEFNEKKMLKIFKAQFQNLIKNVYKNENTYNQ